MKTKLAIGLLSLALTTIGASSQEANTPSDKYVTREEYEKVLKELEAIKSQLQSRSAPQTNAETSALKARIEELEKNQAAQQKDTEQSLDEVDKNVKDLRRATKPGIPGTDRMLLTGYGSGTFQASRNGYGPSQGIMDTPAPGEPRPGRSVFTADFNPIFLWQLSDKLLFESEVAITLNSGGGSNFELEYAQASYVLNDYITFGMGKFLNPVNFFVDRLHPAWINKMPNRPLAVFDGLLPEGIVGAQLHGGAPIGPTKVEYSVFVGNAPSLATQPVDDSHAGLVDFGDNQFAFSHISVGGHVGFFPIPELEIGYGIQAADVGPEGSGVSALWQSVDGSYMRDSTVLKGVIDLRAQWVWSDVDRFTVDPVTGLTPLPAGLTNKRNGGYAQLAYRPTKVQIKLLRDFEPVVRFEMLNQRKTPIGFDESRWSFGLNYWLGSSTVAKFAYEKDLQNGTGQDGDAFLLQFVMGF